MVSLLEHEVKQGIMLRAMSGDIKKIFNDVMHKLYTRYTKGDDEDPAAEWAMIIADFFNDKEMKKYTILLNKLIVDGINPWESKRWIILMKIQLPLQYRRRMSEFTQVPKLGTMLAPKEKVDRVDDW